MQGSDHGHVQGKVSLVLHIILDTTKNVRDKRISRQALYKIKTKIKNGEQLNLNVKVVKILLTLFKNNYLIYGKC